MNIITDLFQDVAFSSVFLIVGIVSLALLILSFILDGVLEAFDVGGDGPLSLTTIGAFGALFGFVGFTAKGFGASSGVALLLSAIVGLVGAYGAWFFSNMLKKSTSSVSISTSTLVGKQAIVTLAIPEGGTAPGEISLSAAGMQHFLAAYSKEGIAGGEIVNITYIRGENSVSVEKHVPSFEETETETEESPKQ